MIRFPSGARLVTALLSAALVTGVSASPASSQVIRGQVLDAADGRRLGFTQVMVLPADRDSVIQGMMASEKATFELRLTAPGTYRLKAELLGYATVISQPLELETRQIRYVELRMDREAIVLDPLTVVAERTESVRMTAVRQREHQGLGTFVFREELDEHFGSRLQEILSEKGLRMINYMYSPGRMSDDEAVARSGYVPVPLVLGRQVGIRDCYASIYVNGAPVFTSDMVIQDSLQDGARRRTALDNAFDAFQLTPDELEAIEIYRGAATLPAEFGGTASECGVVALWTREGRFEWRSVAEPPPAHLRLGASVGRQQLSGYQAPEAGFSLEATASVAALSRIGVSAFLGLGRYALSARTVSGLTGMDQVVPLGGGPATVTFISAGVGPRMALLPAHRVRPVLAARFQVASRSFSAPTPSSPDHPSRFWSSGWGLGLAAALETRVASRLNAELSLGWNWYSFVPYPSLKQSKVVGSRWSGTALQVGASWGMGATPAPRIQ